MLHTAIRFSEDARKSARLSPGCVFPEVHPVSTGNGRQEGEQPRQFPIRMSECEGAHFLRTDPFESNVFLEAHFSAEDFAPEGVELNGETFASMPDALKQFADPDLPAKLFTDFPYQGLLEAFSRFHFASREFPTQAEALVRGAPRDEKPSPADDQRRRDPGIRFVVDRFVHLLIPSGGAGRDFPLACRAARTRT